MSPFLSLHSTHNGLRCYACCSQPSQGRRGLVRAWGAWVASTHCHHHYQRSWDCARDADCEVASPLSLPALATTFPNPCINTPWQILYDSQDDWAFIMTMGFNMKTFRYILTSGFPASWYTTPIHHSDTNATGDPRPGQWSLDAVGALGLVLHYLDSTMNETSLQQILAIIPSTTFRYLTFGLQLLYTMLQAILEAQIQWPQHVEFDELSNLVAQWHPWLVSTFKSINGLKLPIQTSSDVEIENATYNAWLFEHFISLVIVFSSQGTVLSLWCFGSHTDVNTRRNYCSMNKCSG